jgi:hypothetical protein
MRRGAELFVMQLLNVVEAEKNQFIHLYPRLPMQEQGIPKESNFRPVRYPNRVDHSQRSINHGCSNA